MTAKTTATPALPADTTTFYLKKAYVRPIAQAINQLQARTDLSGKFARKVGRVRRMIAKADDEIQEQRKDLSIAHAEKYPEGHAEAGQPTPVYQVGPQGEAIFKKDKAGNDTSERVTLPDQLNIADPVAFQTDYKAMLDELIVVTCPCFTEDEFNFFKGISGHIVDPLMYLEEGCETTIEPKDFKRGLELVGDGEDDLKKIEPPALEPDAPTADEDRTAP